MLAYQGGAGVEVRQPTWFDGTGRRLASVGGPGRYLDVTLSPSETQAAVTVFDEAQGTRHIELLDLKRGSPTRLRLDAGDQNPVWSPEGAAVAFSSESPGTGADLFRRDVGGDERPLLVDDFTKAPLSWSQDGRFLLYSKFGEGQPASTRDLWVLPLTGDGKPFPFLETPSYERAAEFSPDGRWIAYDSTESGRPEVYVRPFPGPGAPQRVSNDGGRVPRWGPDGRNIYYLSLAPISGRALMRAAINGQSAQFEVGPPQRVVEAPVSVTGDGIPFDVARDGRILVNVVTDPEPSLPITLVVDWLTGISPRRE
jgi:Tol biopolymer transport system component